MGYFQLLRLCLFQIVFLSGVSAAMISKLDHLVRNASGGATFVVSNSKTKASDSLVAAIEELSIGSPKFRKVKPLIQNAGLILGTNGKKIFVSYSSLVGEKMSVVFDDPHDVQLTKGQAATWVIELKKIIKYAIEHDALLIVK